MDKSTSWQHSCQYFWILSRKACWKSSLPFPLRSSKTHRMILRVQGSYLVTYRLLASWYQGQFKFRDRILVNSSSNRLVFIGLGYSEKSTYLKPQLHRYYALCQCVMETSLLHVDLVDEFPVSIFWSTNACKKVHFCNQAYNCQLSKIWTA